MRGKDWPISSSFQCFSGISEMGLVSDCFQVVLGISIDFHVNFRHFQVSSGDKNLFCLFSGESW